RARTMAPPRRLRLPCRSMAEHRQQNLQENQENDDRLHQLQAEGGGLIGDDAVDALDHFQLALNAALPFAEMEARRQQPINPSQVLIADQLEYVPRALEQSVGLDF